MGTIKVKTSKKPASVSRAAVKVAVKAVYSNNANGINKALAPVDVIVRVTKKASVAKLGK